MCLHALLTSKRHSIKLIIGNSSLSYCKIILSRILSIYWHIGTAIRNYVSDGSQLCLDFFTASNGTWQGGILSPFLFCRYIHDLLTEVTQSGIGCKLHWWCFCILAYADDIVLLAQSWRAMLALPSMMVQVKLETHTAKIDMKCNENTTVCMVFQPKRRSQFVSVSFPQLTLC